MLDLLDITKARKMLDFNPEVGVEEGVKRFVDWYKDYYDIGALIRRK